MVENDGRVTNRQAFWERFTQEVGIQALALESIFEDPPLAGRRHWLRWTVHSSMP